MLTSLVTAQVVVRREESGREIILSRPGLAPVWRAELPLFLDRRPASVTLVEYIVKLYYRQVPVEAELIGWPALTSAVHFALARANGESDDGWAYAEIVA